MRILKNLWQEIVTTYTMPSIEERGDFLTASVENNLDVLNRFIKRYPAHVNSANDGSGCTALFYAVSGGHDKAVNLLLAAKADPNLPQNNGDTCLIRAAGMNYLPIAEALIASGAQTNICNLKGDSPLSCARKYPQMTELLLNSGADLKKAEHARNLTLTLARDYLEKLRIQTEKDYTDGVPQAINVGNKRLQLQKRASPS